MRSTALTPLGAYSRRSSPPTIGAVMKKLQEIAVVREVTGKQRNRVFAYDRYLEILNRGTAT